ncbi:MAG TPA: ELWxxDGT repeat protein [Myxococcaceae bacterium]|nr:ELWxxDGT repeat protein [Myxococcaceae bacterium]
MKHGVLLLCAWTVVAGCAPPAQAPVPPGAARSGLVAPPPVGVPYLVADLRPGTDSSLPHGSTAVEGGAYGFSASDFRGPSVLWRTDGTRAGTVEVTRLYPDPIGTMAMGRLMFFHASTSESADADRGLWRTDGTSAGTFLLHKETYGTHDRALGASGGRAFFVAYDPRHGEEPWVTDGTVAGTRLLVDLNPGAVDSSPRGFVELGGTAFFTARDEAHGRELWRSDGTAAGTSRVLDLNPGSAGSEPEPQGVLGGVLLFSATHPDTGAELWRTDGTAGGTALVADLNVGGASTVMAPLGVVGGTLYFASGDGLGTGLQIWKTDGTAAGTTRVKVLDSSLLPFAPPRESTVAHGRLFFTIAGGGNDAPFLWTSDGTADGTRPLERAEPGRGPIQVHSLAAAGDWLYFAGRDPNENTTRLWRTNGNPADTLPIPMTVPAHWGAYGLRVAAGRLLYQASDSDHGAELWGMCLSACAREPPTLTCPGTLSVEPRSAAGAEVGYRLAVATVDGLRTEQIEYSGVPGALFPLGITTVTATVTDAQGERASCSFNVIVRDSLPPDLACPQRIQLEADAFGGAELRYPEVEAHDWIGPVTLGYDPAPGTRVPVGYAAAYAHVSATDGAGNVSTCSIVVDVPGKAVSCGCGSGVGGGAVSLGVLLGLWLPRRRIRHPEEGR